MTLKPTPTRRRTRPLSDDDRLVWRHVAHSVTPLEGRHLPEAPLVEPPPTLPVQTAKPHPVTHRREVKPSLPPIAPIETRLRQKVGRGQTEITARLDLHGFTQEAAHRALVAFLRRCQAEGEKLAIVVTGKGDRQRSASDHWYAERGVLRRVVPQWLRSPDLRPLVIGFEEAHPSQGGAGALYVRIRRDRVRP